MRKHQLQRLIDTYNRVVQSPVEEGKNEITGRTYEVIKISYEDWEIWQNLTRLHFKESIKIGGVEFIKEGYGHIDCQHDEGHKNNYWYVDYETIRRIHIFLERLTVLNTYKRVKWEEVITETSRKQKRELREDK